MSIEKNPDAERGPSAPRPGMDVLHVEDDREWVMLVNRWLKKRGLVSLSLGSGVELRSYLARCSSLPRVLLLDKTLPDADGLELCAEIKRSPALQQLPIVMLTGDGRTFLASLRSGALHCVIKGPRTEEELGAVLDAVLLQDDRAHGVIDLDELRLDPRGFHVSVAGRHAASLRLGQFAALRLLVQSSPDSVPDIKLYGAFIERHMYLKRHEVDVSQIVKNYVSALRRLLGKTLGDRLQRENGGYAYRPAR